MMASATFRGSWYWRPWPAPGTTSSREPGILGEELDDGIRHLPGLLVLEAVARPGEDLQLGARHQGVHQVLQQRTWDSRARVRGLLDLVHCRPWPAPGKTRSLEPGRECTRAYSSARATPEPGFLVLPGGFWSSR